ncbi:hypothetical protein MHYP_G00057130 [Metynnis hypsauchen]
MEPSSLHLKSAVEAYLLAAEVLKPKADPRQLTIYAPPGAPCEKALSRTSVVLWLLGRRVVLQLFLALWGKLWRGRGQRGD